MGGAIAQELAISYPNLVNKLILLSTYTSGDPRGDVIFGSLASIRSKVSAEEFLRLSLPWSLSVDEFEIPGFIEGLIRDSALDEYRQEYSAYERQMKATVSFESRGRLSNTPSHYCIPSKPCNIPPIESSGARLVFCM